ncbi:MAG: GNA1162 family protein [Nitrospirota bacterium]
MLAPSMGVHMYVTPRHQAIMVAAVALTLAACAGHRPYVPFGEGITPPRTIAVLPFDNQTNSVPGALYLRETMHDHLKEAGYEPRPLEEVDRALSDQFGVSLGGQVTEEMIPKVGAMLGVDAVLTGTVQKFGTVLALYSEVEAGFAMYESGSGRKIWEYHDHVKEDTALGRRESNSATLAVGLIASVIERGSGKPLGSVVTQFYRRMTPRLPSGAGAIPVRRAVD